MRRLGEMVCRSWSHWLWGCCYIALLIAVNGAYTVAFGEEPGSIRGIVRLGGKGIVNHRVMLIRFAPGQEVTRTPGQTDADGRFVFEQLTTGDAFEYVVGIRYEGRLYRSASVRLQSGQDVTDLAVEVQQAAVQTEDPMAAMYIANHLKVIALRDDHLAVREIVRLIKSEQAASGKGQDSLYIPLPQGYGALTDLQGLDADHVRFERSGLFYTTQLVAGEHRIVLSYEMPFRHKVITMLAERSLPTISLDILVQDTQLIASSNLRFEGRVSFESHAFTHFRGSDLLPQSRSWIQITRQGATIPFLREGAYSVIIGMVLFAIGWAWASPRGGAEPAEPKTAEIAGDIRTLDAARFRLFEEIARLDDAYEAGTLNRMTYERQRDAYKSQLFAFYEREQAMSQTKGVLTEGAE